MRKIALFKKVNYYPSLNLTTEPAFDSPVHNVINNLTDKTIALRKFKSAIKKYADSQNGKTHHYGREMQSDYCLKSIDLVYKSLRSHESPDNNFLDFKNREL